MRYDIALTSIEQSSSQENGSLFSRHAKSGTELPAHICNTSMQAWTLYLRLSLVNQTLVLN